MQCVVVVPIFSVCVNTFFFSFFFYWINSPFDAKVKSQSFANARPAQGSWTCCIFLSVLDLSTACICTTGNLHPTNIDNGVCMRCICRREWIWTHTHPPPMNPDMSLISSHVVCIWGIDVALFFIIHPLLFIVSFVAHWLSEEKKKQVIISTFIFNSVLRNQESTSRAKIHH